MVHAMATSVLCLLLIIIAVSVSVRAATPSPPPPTPCTQAPDPSYPPGMVVDCSRRGWRSVPPGLPPNTTTLLLSNNSLTQLQPRAFLHVPNLRVLDLSYNSITVLHGASFRGLGKLIRLDLYRNKLRLSPATYPAYVFAPLGSLQVLVLSRNDDRLTGEFANCLQSPEIPEVNTEYTPRSKLDNYVNHNTDMRLSPVIQKTPNQSGLNEYPQGFRQATTNQGDSKPLLWSKETDLIPSRKRHGAGVTPGTETHVRALDGEFGYPDKALSRLQNLKALFIDGLTNTSLGPGFAKLKHLTNLYLDGKSGFCRLITVDSTTFANAASIYFLDVKYCGIVNLTRDAFAPLKKLEQLILSYNVHLGFDQLGAAFWGLSQTALNTLHLDAIVPATSTGYVITAEQLRFCRNLTHLETVRARSNKIAAFEPGALCKGMPPKLKIVNFDGNFFHMDAYVNDIWCLGNLEILEVSSISLHRTPPLRPPGPGGVDQSVCSRARHDHTKRVTAKETSLKTLKQSDQTGCNGTQFSVPPKLTTFRTQEFGLQYKLEQVIINSTNNLQRIDVSGNHFPWLLGPMCGFDHVTELYLMDSGTEYINNTFLAGFPALERLNISGNRLRYVMRSDKGQLFRGLNNLTMLDLSRNDMGGVHKELLLPLVNLEELHLKVNGIGNFTLTITHMPRIQHLDLSENQLRGLPQETRDHLDKVAETFNVTVNLTFNPLDCICDNLAFLKWVRDSPVYLGVYRDYFCLQPDGTTKYMDDLVAVIDQLDRTCGNYIGYLMASSLWLVALVTALAMSLAYRFRWKLRYLYYASRLRSWRGAGGEPPGQFRYDAFVCFSSHDDDFVHGELLEHLEEERGVRLCLHTRDFIPGRYIVSNIVDCVQRSRRTVMVLTRDLLTSSWCHYELQMALMESVHSGRDVLLFLIYQHVPAHELSREMLANLQAASHMEYPPPRQVDARSREVFWDRLARALRG